MMFVSTITRKGTEFTTLLIRISKSSLASKSVHCADRRALTRARSPSLSSLPSLLHEIIISCISGGETEAIFLPSLSPSPSPSSLSFRAANGVGLSQSLSLYPLTQERNSSGRWVRALDSFLDMHSSVQRSSDPLGRKGKGLTLSQARPEQDTETPTNTPSATSHLFLLWLRRASE